jgi:hypothetical protein
VRPAGRTQRKPNLPFGEVIKNSLQLHRIVPDLL